MQKWEYLEIKSDGYPSRHKLNKLGAGGWELVEVLASHRNEETYYIAYFKRPKA